MSLKRYLSESQLAATQPVTGDSFTISVNGISNIKSTVTEHATGSITISLDQKAIKALTEAGIAFDDEEEEVEYMPATGDVVRIDHPSAHNGQLGEVVEVAPSGNFAYVEFKDGSVESYHSSDMMKVNDEEAYAYFDDEGEEDDDFDESLGGITRLAGMSKVSEAPGYDQSPGSPYDRGKADAYYGRKGNPTKVIDKPNATVRGERMIVQLTDPEEIKAYYAGYEGSEFGEKDYGTFPDTSDDDVDESMDEIRKLAGMKKEDFTGWKQHEAPAVDKANLKNVIVTSPSGKVYTFDSEEDARRLFLDKWHVVKNPNSGWMVDISATREGIENWGMNIYSEPRTEPFALKKIVVKSKFGKTYTFDNEQEAKQHFGKNWDLKVNNPEWRKANGWKLDMNNTKAEVPVGETSANMLAKMAGNDLMAPRREEKLKALRAKSLSLSDKIDSIVQSGGKVGLNDPLSQELKAVNDKIAALKKYSRSNESFAVYVKESATGKISRALLPNTDFKKNEGVWSYKVWTKR